MFRRDALPTITLPLSVEQETNYKHRHMRMSIADFNRYSECLIRDIQCEGFQPLTKFDLKKQFLSFQSKNRMQKSLISTKLLKVKADKQKESKQNETKNASKILTTQAQNSVICSKITLECQKSANKNILEKIANQLRKNIKYKHLAMKEITKSCQKHRKPRLCTVIIEPILHKNDLYLKTSLTVYKKRGQKHQKKYVCKQLFVQTESNDYGINDVKGWNDLQNTCKEDFINLC